MIAHSSDVGLGQGLGYSLVAEVYLNFGFAGCLLFLLVGWATARQYYRFRLHRRSVRRASSRSACAPCSPCTCEATR